MSPRLLWITPERAPLDGMLRQVPRCPTAVVVMLRRPFASARALLSEGRALRALGVRLVVSQRVDLALALDAHGVHLPERGLPVAEARRLLGPDRWIGVSRHDRQGLLEAAAAGADYATLSPFASVPGKGPALGPTAFSRARRGVPLPVLALGGISNKNALLAISSGADGFAVMRNGAHLDALAALLPPSTRRATEDEDCDG